MSGVRLEHDWFPEALPSNVTIGARSWVYSAFAFRHYRSRRETGVRIGNDSGVYKGSFFNLGPNAQVEIGNYCTLVAAIINTSGSVRIEDYAFVAHEVVLADSCFAIPPGDPDWAQGGGANKPAIRIGRNAWIGARAVLLGGAEIGEGAIVGAGAVVDFAVPPFCVAAGNPARIVSRQRTRERAR
jgi:acetyltransferase-like isoleucine patch superfamily enzyme